MLMTLMIFICIYLYNIHNIIPSFSSMWKHPTDSHHARLLFLVFFGDIFAHGKTETSKLERLFDAIEISLLLPLLRIDRNSGRAFRQRCKKQRRPRCEGLNTECWNYITTKIPPPPIPSSEWYTQQALEGNPSTKLTVDPPQGSLRWKLQASRTLRISWRTSKLKAFHLKMGGGWGELQSNMTWLPWVFVTFFTGCNTWSVRTRGMKDLIWNAMAR